MAERKLNAVGKLITLTCCDCGDAFPFSTDEQEWYASQGWTPPKRCKACREEARRRRGRQGEVRWQR
jgi:hypothetical protein